MCPQACVALQRAAVELSKSLRQLGVSRCRQCSARFAGPAIVDVHVDQRAQRRMQRQDAVRIAARVAHSSTYTANPRATAATRLQQLAAPEGDELGIAQQRHERRPSGAVTASSGDRSFHGARSRGFADPGTWSK